MRKPSLLPFLSVLFVVGLLAGCGPSAPNPEPPAAEAVVAVESAPPASEPKSEPAAPAVTTPAPTPEVKTKKTEPVVVQTTVPAVDDKAAREAEAQAAEAKAAEAKMAEAKAAEAKAAELKAAEAAAAAAVPPPAPDLRLEPAAAFQANAVTVRPAALPTGTVVRYTLDGSDPANGKAFPTGGLAVTQSGRLRVWAAQAGGEASVAEGTYTVGEVWVQSGSSGDGTWLKPLGTLEEALAKASSLGIKRLRLMSGQWTVKLNLSGAWELSGGWKAPGEAGAPSVLVGSKQSGSTQKEPAYTLKVEPQGRVVLSGLDVRAPNSSFGAAVLVDSEASLDASRSRFSGGNGLYGYGLRAVSAGSVTVTDCVLYGGDGGSSFALSADKTSVKVLRSTLDAGTGNAVSYGVNSTLSKLTLISSVVWGGAGNSAYAVGLYSSDGCVLQGSTLLGGKGSSSWALYLSESEPEIAGCLIGSAGKAKSYGIFVNYGKSLPKSLRSTAFFGSSSGAFTGADLGAVSAEPGEGGAFLDASGRAFAGQKGNVKAEPSFGPAPDFRTLASSPAVLLKGAEALPGEAALDRAGKPRGASPAYGAWVISP